MVGGSGSQASSSCSRVPAQKSGNVMKTDWLAGWSVSLANNKRLNDDSWAKLSRLAHKIRKARLSYLLMAPDETGLVWQAGILCWKHSNLLWSIHRLAIIKNGYQRRRWRLQLLKSHNSAPRMFTYKSDWIIITPLNRRHLILNRSRSR